MRLRFLSRDLPTCQMLIRKRKYGFATSTNNHAMQSCRALWDVIAFTYKSKAHHTLYSIHPGLFLQLRRIYAWTKNLAHTTHTHTFRLIFFTVEKSLCTYEKLDTHCNIHSVCQVDFLWLIIIYACMKNFGIKCVGTRESNTPELC